MMFPVFGVYLRQSLLMCTVTFILGCLGNIQPVLTNHHLTIKFSSRHFFPQLILSLCPNSSFKPPPPPSPCFYLFTLDQEDLLGGSLKYPTHFFLLVSFATKYPNDIFAKLPYRHQSRVDWSQVVWLEIPAPAAHYLDNVGLATKSFPALLPTYNPSYLRK